MQKIGRILLFPGAKRQKIVGVFLFTNVKNDNNQRLSFEVGT